MENSLIHRKNERSAMVNIINYKYPSDTTLRGIAVALGYFDGVHVGHRELIALLVNEAKKRGLSPYVLTFADSISKTKNNQSTLYTAEEKIRIFESLGAEGVIVTDFSSVAELSPECFVSEVLIEALGTELAISGYNFRFGKGASADSQRLCELMRGLGKDAVILDEQRIDGKPISATAIRQLIYDKRLDEATRMLGVPYSIEGKVEKGLGLGKAYGFPTVNIPLREDSPLSTGVYRTAVKIGKKLYTGITNIGKCPTVKEREVHSETLIADFEGDIYGENIRIYFLGYLRPEKRFDSIEELREQIYIDKEKSLKENGELTWLEIGLN